MSVELEFEKNENEPISIKSVAKDFDKLESYLKDLKQYCINESLDNIHAVDSPLEKEIYIHPLLEKYLDKYEGNKGKIWIAIMMALGVGSLFIDPTGKYFSRMCLLSIPSLAFIEDFNLKRYFKKKIFKRRIIGNIGIPKFITINKFINWANNEFFEAKILFYLNHRIYHLERYKIEIKELTDLKEILSDIKDLMIYKKNQEIEDLDYYEKLNNYAHKAFIVNESVNGDNKDYALLEKLTLESQILYDKIEKEESKNNKKTFFKKHL